MSPLIDTKRLIVDWHGPRPDGRRFRLRRDRRAGSVYLQVLGLEIVVWYRAGN